MKFPKIQVQGHCLTFAQGCWLKYLELLFSKTAGPVKLKLHMKLQWHAVNRNMDK